MCWINSNNTVGEIHDHLQTDEGVYTLCFSYVCLRVFAKYLFLFMKHHNTRLKREGARKNKQHYNAGDVGYKNSTQTTQTNKSANLKAAQVLHESRQGGTNLVTSRRALT